MVQDLGFTVLGERVEGFGVQDLEFTVLGERV